MTALTMTVTAILMTYMVGIAVTVTVMSYVSNHGVHVAGIVSAVTDNSKGVASVARNAKIASIKIFNSSGKSTFILYNRRD